ncbi:BlaI/MecI/CopY family transcriptional regulator [Actinoallomurus rhizosphaericola]|uniref:BlaI/MecI/CopY family transcriptional regulator n=1 Tax=Actinoallomurus rhizosphaericola TaxID=2952536 RepID=UPI00209350AA|nr:BlaI/MecI/CopY family transcriptional regulator [Actinoallomurus rhizosphaericola]MCO5995294.1 BlaI/MecI/CopY family transcriptional regulator [Actinoallomurus rhizosphaericola]
MNAGHAPGERRPGGALEAEVLGLLQSSSAALTPGEVLQGLGGDLSYSTVVTVLSRMFDKGLLTRGKQGRAYAYAPVADAPGLTARRMRQVLESDADRRAVLARFVEDLSAQDERLLRQLLGGLPDQE